MNILIEGGDLNPPYVEGTRNIARMHFRELHKRGHKVIVLTKQRGIIDKKKHKKIEIIDGIKYYRWSSYIDLFFLYRKLLKEEKIELIHIFAKGLRPPIYMRFLKKSKLPVVYNLLGYPFWTKKDRRIFPGFLKEVDLLIETSKPVYEDFKEKSKIAFMPYGIDCDFFKPVKKNKQRTIMCLRAPTKEFLMAYKKYSNKFKDARLILDKVNLKKDVNNFIRNNDIQNVSFVGYASSIRDILKDADLVVELHPERGFLDCASPPLLLLEAMTFEKKIIATNAPEVKAILQDNKTGLLFENSDSGEIYSCIFDALERKNKLGENARKIMIEKYDIKKVVKNYEKIYKDLILKE